jgi:hypothetical protein
MDVVAGVDGPMTVETEARAPNERAGLAREP